MLTDWVLTLNAEKPAMENAIIEFSRANSKMDEDNFHREIEVLSESNFGENNNLNSSKNVKLAVENDKIYAVWEDNSSTNGAGGDFDIFFRYFDGKLWSDIQVISEPEFGNDLNTGGSGSPNIVVETGKVYVVWTDNTNFNNAGSDLDIFFRCNLTGGSWEDIQVISEPNSGVNNNNRTSNNPDLKVVDGEIYTVWQDNTNVSGSGIDDDIFFRCNFSGSSWEEIQIISEPVQGKNINNGGSSIPKLAVEDSKIFVVWTDGTDINGAGTDYDIFYLCNLTGTSWEPVQIISEPVVSGDLNFRWSYYPDLAVENSNIYVVWMDSSNFSSADQDSDIFYLHNDSGKGWGAIQVLSEPVSDSNFNVASSLMPSIVVEAGKLYVVWYDKNDTYGSGNRDFDIFLRYNITGYDWGSMQILSEPILGLNISRNTSRYPDVAVAKGTVHVVWHDSNNFNGAGSDFDIFYRGISYPLSLTIPDVYPVSGDTSTQFNFTVKYRHMDNIAPNDVLINIRGTNHSMLQADPNDLNYNLNYKDSKIFYYTATHLDIGNDHLFEFWASDGVNTILNKLVYKPEVRNTPPIITTEDILTAIKDINFSIFYEYEDPDILNVGQHITWQFSSNAEWLSFDPKTAVLRSMMA
jgi:hypothetical protein